MAAEVKIWWLGLCLSTCLNVALWLFLAYRVFGGAPAKSTSAARWQLWLSGVYVAGCGFRSVLPRVDVQRFVLFDTWWSNVVLGRTAATAAELSFVAQWALLLFAVGRFVDSKFARAVALCVVPIIALAQIFSWCAVLTTNFFWHMLEESLWALVAVALVAAVLLARRKAQGALKFVLALVAMAGASYVAFMVLIDVPMYASRWLADTAASKSYLSLSTGLSDAASRWITTGSIEDWREEMPWLTLYFSVAVWVSLANVYATREWSPQRSTPGSS